MLSKTVCIAFAHGCVRADEEISNLSRYFTANGFTITKRIQDASLVLVSGCGFDNTAETVSFKLIAKALGKVAPEAHVIIFGCLAGINPERISNITRKNTSCLPPTRIHELDNIINAEIPLKDMQHQTDVISWVRANPLHKSSTPEAPSNFPTANINARQAFSSTERLKAGLPFSRDRFDKFISRLPKFLKPDYHRQDSGWLPALMVARGCPGTCSYCAIRRAIGPLKSTPLNVLTGKFESILKLNHKYIVLTAGDVGAYGFDIGKTPVDLLAALFSFDQDFKLIIKDFNPRWLIKYRQEMMNLLSANVSRIDHIIIPIQSGSDRMLQLMERGYKATEAMEVLNEIREKIPDLKISSHIMVGFPGETDQDFQQTLHLIKKIHFHDLTIFKYDDRPGTEACNLPDKVPESVKRRRLLSLHMRFPGVSK